MRGEVGGELRGAVRVVTALPSVNSLLRCRQDRDVSETLAVVGVEK